MAKTNLKVKDLMKESVYTVGPDDMIDRVFFLLHYEKIRHLPVIEKEKVVGIVTDRDLYKALGPKSNSKGIESGKNKVSHHVIPRAVKNIMHPYRSVARASGVLYFLLYCNPRIFTN